MFFFHFDPYSQFKEQIKKPLNYYTKCHSCCFDGDKFLFLFGLFVIPGQQFVHMIARTLGKGWPFMQFRLSFVFSMLLISKMNLLLASDGSSLTVSLGGRSSCFLTPIQLVENPDGEYESVFKSINRRLQNPEECDSVPETRRLEDASRLELEAL